MAKNYMMQLTFSPAAAAAATLAIDLLKPYSYEPRVASLSLKLGAIASPTDFLTDR